MFESTAKHPCDAPEFVHFRNHIGEQGVEFIFLENIRVNNGHEDNDHFDTAFINSTVQEKDF